MAQTELSKTIKRMNWRLTEYEKKGLEGAGEYQKILREAEKLGLEIGKTKSGFTKIVNKKGYGEAQKLGIVNLEKKFKTVSKVITESYMKAIKRGIDVTGEDAVSVVMEVEAEKNEIHDFIMAHKNDIYKFEDLTRMVRRKEKLTEDEANKLLSMYEERKEELKKIAEKQVKKKRKLLGIEEVEKEGD